MSKRNTVIRSLHDLGAAAWFGGSLMGAVGLNGAAADAVDPKERATLAADGWARWAPVNAAAIGLHLIGGVGLVIANRDRVRGQEGVTANTVTKTLVTGAALAATGWSGVLGARIAAAGRDAYTEGATEPSPLTPEDVANAQQQLRALQWVIPALTGVIVSLGAQQGEQQRPAQIAAGYLRRISTRS